MVASFPQLIASLSGHYIISLSKPAAYYGCSVFEKAFPSDQERPREQESINWTQTGLVLFCSQIFLSVWITLVQMLFSEILSTDQDPLAAKGVMVWGTTSKRNHCMHYILVVLYHLHTTQISDWIFFLLEFSTFYKKKNPLQTGMQCFAVPQHRIP